MRKRKMYLSVEDIAELFGLSVSFAYRVVERMNADLESKNYYVIGSAQQRFFLFCRWADVFSLDT